MWPTEHQGTFKTPASRHSEVRLHQAGETVYLYSPAPHLSFGLRGAPRLVEKHNPDQHVLATIDTGKCYVMERMLALSSYIK